MHKNFFLLIVFLLVLAAGCSPQPKANSSDFPMDQGTTWVYSYEVYEPAGSDSDQIINATYQLTETVVETETNSPYFIAHVKRGYELVSADNDWTTDTLSNQPDEFWYVVRGHQIFQSNLPIDAHDIKTDEFILDYEFPLSTNRAWCLFRSNLKNPDQKVIADCVSVGRRAVTNHVAYETQAGSFDNCYDLVDYFNGGNIFQKFCNGVGIVFRKFDHAGTRFGYEQTLLDYSLGAP